MTHKDVPHLGIWIASLGGYMSPNIAMIIGLIAVLMPLFWLL